MPSSPWFPFHRPDPRARLTLFCFPYAGGGASAFRRWESELPAEIAVAAAAPPGRELRLAEAPVERMAGYLESLWPALLERAGGRFALFGHSLGALVAFEVARALRRSGGPQPLHLFVAGAGTPQIATDRRAIHALCDDDFVAEIARFGGTPRELLDEPELMRVFLPALRADFAVRETYEHSDEAPLALPMTAFGGERDAVIARARLEGWREQTSARFRLELFQGGHFFLQGSRSLLLGAIARDLAPYLEADLRA